MNRREKEQVVSDLSKRAEGFKAVVLTHYRGLKVEQLNQLRQRLRGEKVSYHVVKNTLMKLATKGTPLEKLSDYFEGPTAMAISYGDPISLVKIVLDFVKTQPSLEIKVGLVEGKVVAPGEMKALASMPPREVLLAQLLGVIQGPARQLAGGLVSTFQEFVYLLQARIDQLASSEEAPAG